MGLLTMVLVICFSATIPPPTQADTSSDSYNYIQEHETDDEVFAGALEIVRAELPSIVQSIRRGFPTVDLFVVRFDDDMPPHVRNYAQQTCVAISAGLPNPSIVCNEEYLVEAEIAITRFEDGTKILTKDASMFNFVTSSTLMPPLYLEELRTVSQRQGWPSRQHIVEHMSLVLLFYAGHELGHLLNGTESGAYDRDMPTMDTSHASDILDRQAARDRRAKIIMCRHVNEFINAGFGLENWEKVAGFSGDQTEAAAIFKSNYTANANQEQPRYIKQLKEEDAADDVAVDVVMRFLSKKDKLNADKTKDMEYVLMETLFAVAVYDWHKHLVPFVAKSCPGYGSAGLSNCLAKSPEVALKARQAFGRDHRFLMLRAYKAIRTIWVGRIPDVERVPGIMEEDVEALTKEKDPEKRKQILRRIQRGDIGMRYLHLYVLMDTPVKFAYLGCSSDWFAEKKIKSQALGKRYEFRMIFDSLEESSKRHQTIIDKVRRGESIDDPIHTVK